MGLRGPQSVNIMPLLRLERDWDANLRLLVEGAPSERLGPSNPSRNLVPVAPRRDIWERLMDARTSKDVQAACAQWRKFLAAKITDEQSILANYSGLLDWPKDLSRYAVDFLKTIRDKRFPRRGYSVESRLTHISRGLAGAMIELRPATAIDRLRKMEHGLGGPLWSRLEKRCCCWRCSKDVKYLDLFVPSKV
jgi:hypothetical protein